MSLISRLHNVLESSPKDQYVELKTTTPMEELRRVANLENIPLDRLKFVERLEDGEYGLLDMEENIFYRTAKDVKRGFETYNGTIMTFEDPEVKKWLVSNIGGERGITNSTYGVVGVKGVTGEVTYEQALATRYIDFGWNKSIRRFNELIYFKNLNDVFFRESTIEELSLPYTSIRSDLCFYNCDRLRKLTTKYGLDIKGSNTLRYCSLLSDLDTSKWTITGYSVERMFQGCRSITKLDLRSAGMSNVTILSLMFESCTGLRELIIDDWNLENVGLAAEAFSFCTSLQSLDTSKWNLGNLINGQNMFNGCTSLQSLDTSKWNLGNLINGTYMFSSTAITTLDVRNWDLRKLIYSTYMFFNNPLKNLDTSGWRLNGLLSARCMFQHCYYLISLGDTSRWGIENLTDAVAMFHNCNALQSLDTSGWSLENVTTMEHTFNGCLALTSFGDTSKWNPIRCTNYSFTFNNCRSLTKIDLSYRSSPPVNNPIIYGIVNDSNQIESFVGEHTETDNISIFNGYNRTDFDLTPNINLNLASILASIRGLGTNTTRRKFIPPRGFDKSRIPQEYKTMLENKNWELA